MNRQYSRIILNTIYPEEATETTAFFDDLTNTCEEQLTGEYHLIGNSAMTYEMQQSFDQKCCLSRCFDIFHSLTDTLTHAFFIHIAFRRINVAVSCFYCCFHIFCCVHG